MLIFLGKGVEKDVIKSLQLYYKACNGGVSSSCNNLKKLRTKAGEYLKKLKS